MKSKEEFKKHFGDKSIYKSDDEIKKNIANLFKSLKKNYKIDCLHPQNSECIGKSIKAHSIQRSKILTKLSEDNHVIIPDIRIDPYSDPEILFKEKGINEASTFEGLCIYHDTNTFKTIETNEIDITNYEHLFLYAYRAVIKQYFVKLIAYFKSKDLIEIHKPKDNFIIELLNRHVYYNHIGLKFFEKIKGVFDYSYINKKYKNRIVYNNIILDYELPISVNSAFTPTYGFNGKLINDYDEKIMPRNVVLNVFPENCKTYILIAHLKKQDKFLSYYVNNFKNIEKITDTLSETIFKYIENFAISPKYWNNIPTLKKANIINFWKLTLLRGKESDKKNIYNPQIHNLFQ